MGFHNVHKLSSLNTSVYSYRVLMDDRISIIVPTYNRKVMLKRLLDSFSTLHCHCPLEFIIVDDCSDDGTRLIVEDWKKTMDFTDVKYHYLPSQSGPAVARNAGILISTGNVLAFTDSDCVVDPAWAENLYQRLISSPEYAGVGGRVLPVNDDIYSTYNTVFRILEPPRHINAVIGANCMFWKQLVVDVGMFDDYFINPGGEEIALCMKLWIRGYRFGFDEQAIVYHDYRQNFRAFVKTFYSYGRGERIIIKNRLKEYLQYMKYPEQIYNYLAFRNFFLFWLGLFIHLVVSIIPRRASSRSSPLPGNKKFSLIGLAAIHHFSYHLGRGTFSGVLVKEVRKYLAKHPECVLTLHPGTDSISPLLEITADSIPPVFKPGQRKKSSITIKNPRPDLWLSAEFLIIIQNNEEHITFYKTQKLQNTIFFPGAELAYDLTFKAPLDERDYIVQVHLMTPDGIPLSNKREKIIRVSSKLPDPDAKIIETTFP
jgi:glycosyltransferase involved in cell wall biosynthesis